MIASFFNSHPHKEDDDEHWNTRRDRVFSTHILTRRMTSPSTTLSCLIVFFNSHPHKEDDDCIIFWFYFFFFSTHILTRRMTSGSTVPLLMVGFSTHILTRRMTAEMYHKAQAEAFQLTSSQGGWRYNLFKYYNVSLFFNSHPHKEDDSCSCRIGKLRSFSTHILTRRMTMCTTVVSCIEHFSTHILTRRMTIFIAIFTFAS